MRRALAEAKRMRLTVVLAIAVTELLTQLGHLVFEFRDAAVVLVAAGALRTSRSHEQLLKQRFRIVKNQSAWRFSLRGAPTS